MTSLMTLNDFIAKTVKFELTIYVQTRIKNNNPLENFEQEKNNYMSGDYEYHLSYLIETWKKIIDDEFVDDPIDYNRQDTFAELWHYAVIIQNIPMFDEDWIEDIFESDILHTNIILK